MSQDAGNLCFEVSPDIQDDVRKIVDRGHSGEDIESVLCEIGNLREPTEFEPIKSDLVVVYSDFNIDDSIGIAALLELQREILDFRSEPILIWHTNFDGQDNNTIFEKKLLLRSLTLGRVKTYVLPHEGDQGGAGRDEGELHPHAMNLIANRTRVLEELAEKISKFQGERIHFYIMSPGRGNLAAITRQLTCVGWPAKARWRIAMYSGAYNIRGMHDADMFAIQQMLNYSDDPLVDISNFIFFGAQNQADCTKSASTFLTADFGEQLAKVAPLVAAALKLYHDEFCHRVTDPSGDHFLDDTKPLSEDEKKRLADLDIIHDAGSTRLQEFAQKMIEDKPLFDKLRKTKQHTLKLLAAGGYSFPLCDMLIFLHAWTLHYQPSWLAKEEVGWWCIDKKTGFATIENTTTANVAVKAIQPRLKDPTNQAQLDELRATMEKYFWMRMNSLRSVSSSSLETFQVPPIRCELHRDVSVDTEAWESGNLTYPVSDEYAQKVEEILQRMRKGDELNDILGADPPKQTLGVGEKSLTIVYTDLEPDDAMAIAQLWQWKRDTHELSSAPLLIWHPDFDNKEKGMIFEKKELLASLMLSQAKFHILLGEDDSGKEKHPRFDELSNSRSAIVRSIADVISQFRGDRIDFYIIAPGHGNIGAIVSELQKDTWPLKASWQVFIYSGAFNMRGMFDADISALKDIMSCSKLPLVDISKFPFFGGKEAHQWAGSLTTFATETFAKKVSAEYPLLAAALKTFNDEFNASLVPPKQDKLFGKKCEFSDDEMARWHAIKREHSPSNMKDFARALVKDESLFKKVLGFKKNTLRAFAGGGCDSPLCDQLVFLYEWLLKEQPQCLTGLTPGWWHFDKEKGFTSISADVEGPFKAIQPVLSAPNDEESLMMMRSILETNLLKYMSVNACRGKIQAKIADLCIGGDAAIVTRDGFENFLKRMDNVSGRYSSQEAIDLIMKELGDGNGCIDVKAFLNWAFV